MNKILILVFSTWFILTILWQFDDIREQLKFLYRLNILNAIPIWTFFAPTPGITDTHIIFRDKKSNLEVSEWGEIVLLEERRWYHFIWNPHKRKSKLIVDALSQIKSLKNKSLKNEFKEEELQYRVQLSKGYLILLNLVMNYEMSDNEILSRQFMVVDSYLFSGKRQPFPIFSSPFHTLK
jgi:hypothetical protein